MYETHSETTDRAIELLCGARIYIGTGMALRVDFAKGRASYMPKKYNVPYTIKADYHQYQLTVGNSLGGDRGDTAVDAPRLRLVTDVVCARVPCGPNGPLRTGAWSERANESLVT